MENEFHLLRKHAHEDLIHDVSFDFYGKRLVTCSSDQRLKVWNLNESSGKWELNDSWIGHDSAILKVTWAHPEYGQVIASGSADKTVRIWEEYEHEPRNSNRRWVERARLSDSRGIITDIEFSPHHFGLKIISVALDGILRIYEAIEVNNLSNFTLMDEFEIGPSSLLKETEGQYCVSWGRSRYAPYMLAVGCGKEHLVRIYKMDIHNKWQSIEILTGHQDIVRDVAFAPSFGRSFQLIATACKDGRVRIFKMTPREIMNENNEICETNDLNNEENEDINDINDNDEENSNNGSGYHEMMDQKSTSSLSLFNIEEVGNFSDHSSEVWKVDWNVTGTILASSGDDGKVRLWKSTYTNEWKCMSVVSAEHMSVTPNLSTTSATTVPNTITTPMTAMMGGFTEV